MASSTATRKVPAFKLLPGRDVVPPSSPDLTSNVTNPLTSNVANPLTDPTLVQTHEPEHGTLKPSPVVSKPSSLAQARGHHHKGGDRHFISADDNVLMKQILNTHLGDDEFLDVRPVLYIIEEIIRRATPPTVDEHGTRVVKDTLEEPAFHAVYQDPQILQLLAHPIKKVSSELICKCAAGADAHSATIGILGVLSSYSWDAKAVISFAGFAVNYGEFWLVAQLYATNPLAKCVGTLKDLPETMEHAHRQKFEAVLNLVKAIVDVTNCIIKFRELPSQYITHDTPLIQAAIAHIPTTVYWVIRSIYTCAAVLMNLIGRDAEYITSTAESWELLSLAHKLQHMFDHLNRQLELCNEYVEERKRVDAFNTLKRLFETSHLDNMKILRALIYAKDDPRPIYDGTRRTKEALEILKRKYVLLLISDLELPHDELSVLHQIYSESTEQSPRHEYEVVWLPLIDRAHMLTDHQRLQFNDLQASMPWFSVANPSYVDPVAIKFIKEFWRFQKKPMLVVLDPQGKVSNINAFPMIWIWGGLAFPFTRLREEALWREFDTWNIELLADHIYPDIMQWIVDKKCICIYGGDDIEWIRKFTRTARSVASSLGVPLEMLYVGKSTAREKLRTIDGIVKAEKLSHTVPDMSYIWFFWVRLASMWNSKQQHGMTVDNDRIMQEIMAILTFDGGDQGWAVFSKGAGEIAQARADILTPVFERYDKWSVRMTGPDDFVPVLAEEIKGVHPEHHCNRLILPGSGNIPDRITCSECGKVMEKFVMYRCCED